MSLWHGIRDVRNRRQWKWAWTLPGTEWCAEIIDSGETPTRYQIQARKGDNIVFPVAGPPPQDFNLAQIQAEELAKMAYSLDVVRNK